MRLLTILIVALTCQACKHTNNRNAEQGGPAAGCIYARGFSYNKTGSDILLTVKNPWQQAKEISLSYILRLNSQSKKDIKIPVKRVVCLSTTHIAMVSKLGEASKIVGVSGKNLISDPGIRCGIDSGRIVDVGYEQTLNYELIASLNPDVVFAYGVSTDITNYVTKLTEFGLHVVLVAEYLETDPLAKAEWIKFFAAFFDKEALANQLFDSISTEYNKISTIALAGIQKPTVISGLSWNGTWYVSGGQSYLAKLIADAGGKYMWADLETHESIPIDLEKIYMKSLEADYWINLSTAHSKADVLESDKRFASLKAFRTGNLYNNNARESVYGSNDYWESGVCNPQIILADLVAIFHPEIYPDRNLYYYKKIAN